LQLQLWSHTIKLELELRGKHQHQAEKLFKSLEAALAAVPSSDAGKLKQGANLTSEQAVQSDVLALLCHQVMQVS